ncbi:MAG: preprotein translocase subunit YajC [Actinomycetota bacterium]|nr:preprotein translocase subunit YajC [Actinomycetota bacterium]
MAYLIPVLILVLLMWILVARPQRRRQVAQMSMQDNLRIGDEVITAGGIHAQVRRLDEDVLTIEIAPGTEVRIDRRAIAAVVSPDEELEAEEESPLKLENKAPDEP